MKWLAGMEDLLLSLGLREYAFGETGVAPPVRRPDETAVHFHKRVQDDDERRQRAVGLIGLHLSHELRVIVRNEAEPREVVRKLDERLKPSQYLAHARLFHVRHDPEAEDLDAYFNRVDELAYELAAVMSSQGKQQETTHPLMLLVLMLKGLPAEYDATRTFIETNNIEDMAEARDLLRQRQVELRAAQRNATKSLRRGDGGRRRGRGRGRHNQPQRPM